MSRKTLLTILGVLAAAGAVVSTEFGLHANLGAVITTIAAVLVYVFNEAKLDLANLASQKAKWTDQKFLTTMVAAIIGAIGAAGVTLPIAPEIIIAVLTGIIQALFKTQTSDPRVAALRARRRALKGV